MRPVTFATVLWEANDSSFEFSKCYDDSWVDKLYRGFARNYDGPFRFVCYTDRLRDFAEDVIQRPLVWEGKPDYSCCIQPFAESLHSPMILCGLDTIITGDMTPLVEYVKNRWNQLALPLDPLESVLRRRVFCNGGRVFCNGVCLVPMGNELIYLDHNGENDMDWLNGFDPVAIDEKFPGQVLSYKGHILKRAKNGEGLGDARMIYFHGDQKPHELLHLSWVKDNWY